MLTEHGKIEGNLYLNYELKLHGMVAGDVEVVSGGFLELHGTCCNNLTIQDGEVYLYGTVTGDVVNQGGYLEVHGSIIGRLQAISGETIVDKNAKIGK